MGWDNTVRCTINYDVTWDITSATLGNITRRDLNDAWNIT
jgi:hypothetical protein